MHYKNEVTQIIASAIVGSHRRVDIAKIHQLMDDYAEDQKSLPDKKIKCTNCDNLVEMIPLGSMCPICCCDS